MRTGSSDRLHRGTVPFGSLQLGQRFRIVDAHGVPVLTVLYTRIPDTVRQGMRRNALGWGTHPDGRQGRHYCRFAPATPVLLDTLTVLTEEADAVAPLLAGAEAFDPATTSGPPPGTFDPNLEDVW